RRITSPETPPPPTPSAASPPTTGSSGTRGARRRTPARFRSCTGRAARRLLDEAAPPNGHELPDPAGPDGARGADRADPGSRPGAPRLSVHRTAAERRLDGAGPGLRPGRTDRRADSPARALAVDGRRSHRPGHHGRLGGGPRHAGRPVPRLPGGGEPSPRR